MATIEPLPRGRNPFDTSGIAQRTDGSMYYETLPASLLAMLKSWVEKTPEEEVVVEVGGERLTYAAFWTRSARVAGGLRANGIERGDRVAIRLQAGIAWTLAFFGTLMAGATVVPVNTRFSEAEAEYVITDSGSKYVFVPGDVLPEGAEFCVEDLGHDDRAGIFYTSGTTGFPKGAITTHLGFLTNCENMLRCMRLPLPAGERVRTLISVPLFHVTGCNSQFLVAMAAGGSSIVLPALDLAVFLRTIPEERITLLVTVPAVYALAIGHPAFANTDVSGVHRVGYGGAPIAPALVHKIKAAFPNATVQNGFGMTESASLLTSLPDADAAAHADSVGFACPVVDLALEDVDPGTNVGQLIVRGPNITPGYWNKPEANASTFVEGWLRTGDLARVDGEGLVYIVDRVKDMICRGGENVYCVEVENALAGVPGVAECSVIGVPDDVMGEKVGLVVVPAPATDLDLSTVIASLKGVIADFKIPQFASVRATPLPRNPGGKVLKKQLREETVWGKQLR